jgi:hypothetical protein
VLASSSRIFDRLHAMSSASRYIVTIGIIAFGWGVWFYYMYEPMRRQIAHIQVGLIDKRKQAVLLRSYKQELGTLHHELKELQQHSISKDESSQKHLVIATITSCVQSAQLKLHTCTIEGSHLQPQQGLQLQWAMSGSFENIMASFVALEKKLPTFKPSRKCFTRENALYRVACSGIVA